MDFAVKIEGLQGIEDALAKAGPKLARSAVRKGLDKGGKVFLGRAKTLVPVLQKGTPQRQPGELRDAIAEVVTTNPRKQSGRARVGLKYSKKGSQDPGVYGLFVEFGTAKMPARPYMRPAYDEARAEAQRVFTEELRAGVADLGKK